MAKNEGKRFEEDLAKSIPHNYYVERYKDDTAGFSGVANPADYRVFRYPYLFLLELKSHKGHSIPLSCIRDKQVEGMLKANQYEGVYAGFIFNYRDYAETYYVSIGKYLDFVFTSKRLSIPVEWVREHGVKISQHLKRTRYGYDMETFLGGFYGKQRLIK